ncbi:hypothetical protein AGDE_13662 [Angomonas deanei]|uniref:Uncharacterized protein n=1 Tax=Angomonas deanei TaxID=59799 RepID=A0A7G2CJZ9_9TRYP|nr:hypothetical protein AGDE_13662 [Angomonas deanei]CAD2220136.1 hypothetical protein, conserved [Angomonas deanei]|eukprot:EPY21988.1 hypothetical protein AGDE_13662 [Angomonas deanei]
MSTVALGSGNLSSELALKTIQDQQAIIGNLHELVVTLKAELQSVSSTLQQEKQKTNDSGGEKEEWLANKKQLVLTQASLLQEKDALQAQVQRLTNDNHELQSQLEWSAQQQTALATQLAQLTAAQDSKQQLYGQIDHSNRELLQQVGPLREEIKQLEKEKTRWKSLSLSLIQKLDVSLQSRMMAHVAAMEREESAQRRTGPRATIPALATSPVVMSEAPEVAAAWKSSSQKKNSLEPMNEIRPSEVSLDNNNERNRHSAKMNSALLSLSGNQKGKTIPQINQIAQNNRLTPLK